MADFMQTPHRVSDDELITIVQGLYRLEFEHKMRIGRWLMANPQSEAKRMRMAEKVNATVDILAKYEFLAKEFQDWDLEELPTTAAVCEELVRIPDPVEREILFNQKPPQEWKASEIKQKVDQWFKDHKPKPTRSAIKRQGFAIGDAGEQIAVTGDANDPDCLILEVKPAKNSAFRRLTSDVKVAHNFEPVTGVLYIKMTYPT